MLFDNSFTSGIVLENFMGFLQMRDEGFPTDAPNCFAQVIVTK